MSIVTIIWVKGRKNWWHQLAKATQHELASIMPMA
jgi:hypothetical protein